MNTKTKIMSTSLLLTETPEMIQDEANRNLTTFPFQLCCFKSCQEVYEKPLLDSKKNLVQDPMIIIKNQNPFNDKVCNYYVVHRYIHANMLYLNIIKQLEDQMTTVEVTDDLPDCEPVLMEIRECKTNRTNPSSLRMFELVWDTPDM